MSRYLVKIDDKEFDIELKYNSDKYYALLNGKEFKIDSYKLGENRAVLLIEGKSLEVDVHSNGYDNRKTVFLKGTEIAVDIEDYNLAQLRKTVGLSSDKIIDKTVKAPMPGLILDVKVTAGDTVEKGQPLLIIEAMKMENIIKASGKAVVKEVLVKKGASVEKGSKLLELE